MTTHTKINKTAKKQRKYSYQFQFFEKAAWKEKRFVCGIDEAGRGPLAGPVTAAAVILPINTSNPLLKDSKIITPKQRSLAFDWITKHCFFSVVHVSTQTIDAINIYQATKQAMRASFIQLIMQYTHLIPLLKYVVIDAMPLTIDRLFKKNIATHSFNFGETISPSIAAASIVAKTSRDALMLNLAKQFPAYHLQQHKGYGTKKHLDALKRYGPSLLHRTSFLKKIKVVKNDHYQQAIF